MKDFSEFLKNEKARKRFASYSPDRQDEIIDRINRKWYLQLEKEAEWEIEDYEKNPDKYFTF